jgi:hypothetical protein
MLHDVDYGASVIVSTERLGWPRGLGIIQPKLRYPDRPEQPSATCHLQPETEAPALCGHPWEALIMIPGDVERLELHPDMRCDGPGGCEERAGINPSDDPGCPYRFARTQP